MDYICPVEQMCRAILTLGPPSYLCSTSTAHQKSSGNNSARRSQTTAAARHLSKAPKRMHADRAEKLVAAEKAYTDGLLYLVFDLYRRLADDGHVESQVFVA